MSAKKAAATAPAGTQIGQWVRDADDRKMRVTMICRDGEPWGRLDGNDANEPERIKAPWRAA